MVLEFQYFRNDLLTVRNTWCMTWGSIGGIKVTVPCMTSRNKSYKLQLVLLRVVQQRKKRPDSETVRIMLERTSVSNREDGFSEITSKGGVETTENTYSKQKKNTKQIEKLELGILQLTIGSSQVTPLIFPSSWVEVRTWKNTKDIW